MVKEGGKRLDRFEGIQYVNALKVKSLKCCFAPIHEEKNAQMEWLNIYYNLGCIPADEMKFVLKHLPGKVTYKVRLTFYKKSTKQKLLCLHTGILLSVTMQRIFTYIITLHNNCSVVL
jgi:hypothetical protein